MLDIKHLAQHAMQKAQGNLKRFGHLDPVAFLMNPNSVVIVGLAFNSIDAKHAAYEAIAQLAKKQQTLAIVTVNDARMSKVDFDAADLKNLSRAEKRDYVEALPFRPDRECIVVASKCPGAPGYALVCPYVRKKGVFVFAPIEDFPDSEIFMVPDWD